MALTTNVIFEKSALEVLSRRRIFIESKLAVLHFLDGIPSHRFTRQKGVIIITLSHSVIVISRKRTILLPPPDRFERLCLGSMAKAQEY
jgi:hypothetical protein